MFYVFNSSRNKNNNNIDIIYYIVQKKKRIIIRIKIKMIKYSHIGIEIIFIREWKGTK